MKYPHGIAQKKEEFIHEDKWADSIIKGLTIFLTIIGIPYTLYIFIQFLLSF